MGEEGSSEEREMSKARKKVQFADQVAVAAAAAAAVANNVGVGAG